MASNTSPGGPSPWYEACLREASRYLELDYSSVRVLGNVAEIRVLSPPRPLPWSTALNLAYRGLVRLKCYPRLVKRRDGIFLLIVRKGERGSRLLTGMLLAAVTLFTVYLSGIALTGVPHGKGGFAWSPLGYLTALLIPLVLHELGHWMTLRRYSTPASIPYLLPAPPLQLGFLGTFGAVINLRWLPPSDRALALSAIAGPLAGFIVALPFAIIGLKESVVLPAAAAGGVIPLVPLVFLLLPAPEAGPHEVVILSPMAFASFVVFFVTFLNLIPVASLDGGHIVRAVLGPRGHMTISYAATLALILASMKWHMLTLFALLALVMLYMNRNGHPGSAMGIHDPTDRALSLALAVYVALLLLTLPVPVS